MPRLTITFDEEDVAWVEKRATERGVSKSKVVRDVVAAARDADAGMVSRGEMGELEERVRRLEQRMADLEAERSVEAAATEDDTECGGGESADSEPDEGDAGSMKTEWEELAAGYRSYLDEREISTEAGREAIVATVRILREEGSLATKEIRSRVYGELEADAYADGKSMWQSIQRFFEELPGIEKAGFGEWQYGGDEALRDVLAR